MNKIEVEKFKREQDALATELYEKAKTLPEERAIQTILGDSIRYSAKESLSYVPRHGAGLLTSNLIYDRVFVKIHPAFVSSNNLFKKLYGLTPEEMAALATEQKIVPVLESGHLHRFNPEIFQKITSAPFTTEDRLLEISRISLKEWWEKFRNEGLPIERDAESQPSDKWVRKDGKNYLKIELKNGKTMSFQKEALIFIGMLGISLEDFKYIIELEGEIFGEEWQKLVPMIICNSVPEQFRSICLGASYQAKLITEIASASKSFDQITFAPFESLEPLFSKLGILYSHQMPMKAYSELVLENHNIKNAREIVRDAISQGCLHNEAKLHELVSSINQDILDIAERRTRRIKLLYCLSDLSIGYFSEMVKKIQLSSINEKTKTNISEFVFQKTKGLTSKLLGKKPYIVQLNHVLHRMENVD